MRIFYRHSTFAALSMVGLLAAGAAQSESRQPGWEFRGDLLYQNQKDVVSKHGSDLNFDTSWNGSVGAGYRFSPYLELALMVDFQSINYDANVQSADIPGVTAHVSDKANIYTPRLVGNLNFINGPFTPYVSLGAGWSMVDSHVANVPQDGTCWWDPWQGYTCSAQGKSFHNDGFAYDVGAGLRWDITQQFGMRFAYEKHWIHMGGETGTPNLDQFRVGIQFGF